MNIFIKYFFILFFLHTRYTHSMFIQSSMGKNMDLPSQVNSLEKDLKNLRSECRLVLDTGVSQFKRMDKTISIFSQVLLNNINDNELIIPGLANSIKRIQNLEKEIESIKNRIDKLDKDIASSIVNLHSINEKAIQKLGDTVNLNDRNLIGLGSRTMALEKHVPQGFLLMGTIFSLVIIFQQYQIYMLKQK